jgi:hypothetical protein
VSARILSQTVNNQISIHSLMSNNIFYKALAAVSTTGIIVLAATQVSTALKIGQKRLLIK